MNKEFNEAIKHYAKIMKVSETEAREDAEATIKMFMTDEGYTREFAENSWIEDTMDMTAEGMQEIEKNAKANAPKLHAKSTAVDAFGKKRVRERKPNDAKRAIMALLQSALEGAHRLDEEEIASGIESVNVSNIERQVDFVLDGVNYSITLTAHRAPKAK